ncbi:unnamed protein product [Linum tenue]|uniref:Uncharacterized protein n=1 Tax=Linum tenue TaxID=586396 RepID=A0AAV0KDN2_9ROSI|nr:unnamed protein product [Linum tenue]
MNKSTNRGKEVIGCQIPSFERYPLDSLLKNEYWSRRNDCFRWQVVAEGSGLETMLCVMTGSDVLRSRGSISGLIRP